MTRSLAVECVGLTVEGQKLFAINWHGRTTMPPLSLRHVECMQWLAHFHEHVVGDVDDVVDRAQADGIETFLAASPGWELTRWHRGSRARCRSGHASQVPSMADLRTGVGGACRCRELTMVRHPLQWFAGESRRVRGPCPDATASQSGLGVTSTSITVSGLMS